MDAARLVQIAVARADLWLCALARLPWERVLTAWILILVDWGFGR